MLSDECVFVSNCYRVRAVAEVGTSHTLQKVSKSHDHEGREGGRRGRKLRGRGEEEEEEWNEKKDEE